jgi:hypothetical protein
MTFSFEGAQALCEHAVSKAEANPPMSEMATWLATIRRAASFPVTCFAGPGLRRIS